MELSAASRQLGVLAVALLAACAGGDSPRGAGPVSPVDALGPAGLGPGVPDWQRACVGWIQASCEKARACGAKLGLACLLSPARMVEVCNQEINGGRCRRPVPASFESCRSRVAAASCAQYCPAGSGQCPDVCAFTCLDSLLPETPDAGPIARGPDAPATVDGAPVDGTPVEGTPVADPARGLTRLPLALSHLVVDRARRRLYATVRGRSRVAANSLVVIDAQSLKVVSSIPVGPEPSVLALSADGSKVWVGVNGDQTLRDVAVGGPELVAGPPRPLPRSLWSPSRPIKVRAMVGLAGSADSVVLTLDSPSTSGLHGSAVLDAGVVRGSLVDLDAGQLVGGADGWVFGFNDSNSGHDFLSIAVGSAGLEMTAKLSSLLREGGRIVYADQRVYAANGRVIDVAQPRTPKLLASFGFTGMVAVDTATTTAFMLSTEDRHLTLRAMDTVQFYQRALLDLGRGSEFDHWDFDRLDADTFVFVGGTHARETDEGASVYLVSDVTSRLKSYRVEGP